MTYVIKMGCDYFTDENGKLEIHFYDHKTSRVLNVMIIHTKEPNHPISIGLIEGRAR